MKPSFNDTYTGLQKEVIGRLAEIEESDRKACEDCGGEDCACCEIYQDRQKWVEPDALFADDNQFAGWHDEDKYQQEDEEDEEVQDICSDDDEDPDERHTYDFLLEPSMQDEWDLRLEDDAVDAQNTVALAIDTDWPDCMTDDCPISLTGAQLDQLVRANGYSFYCVRLRAGNYSIAVYGPHMDDREADTIFVGTKSECAACLGNLQRVQRARQEED